MCLISFFPNRILPLPFLPLPFLPLPFLPCLLLLFLALPLPCLLLLFRDVFSTFKPIFFIFIFFVPICDFAYIIRYEAFWVWVITVENNYFFRLPC